SPGPSSKLKSSSAPIGREDSWCFHAVGSSNAPLLGSTAAEGLPRIGRTSIATHWRSCGLPQSASSSENFVIPPDVFGQTLRHGCLLSLGNWLHFGLAHVVHHHAPFDRRARHSHLEGARKRQADRGEGADQHAYCDQLAFMVALHQSLASQGRIIGYRICNGQS